MIPANIELLAFAYQEDKDTPADTPTIAIAIKDESLRPNPTRVATPKSDATAQKANEVVVGAEPGGSFTKYLVAEEDDFFLYGLLGKDTVTPGDPNLHDIEIDPDDPFGSPYLTCWQIWPGIATTRYDGCRIAQAKLAAGAGEAWTAEYTLLGRKATLGVDEPDLFGILQDILSLSWPEASTSLGGDTPGTVNKASYTISRGTSRFPGDVGLQAYDLPNGLVDVFGDIEIAFADDALYRAANTGAENGTDLTTTTFSEELITTIARGAGRQVKLEMAAAQIKNYNARFNTDGSPGVATFDFATVRQPTLADVLTITVANDQPTADRS